MERTSLTEDYRIDWEPGVRGGVPVGANIVTARGVDDSADNGAVIQRAIDKAFGLGGGAVVIPKGSYRVERTLRLKSGVVLRGAPGAVPTLEFNIPKDNIPKGGANSVKIAGKTGEWTSVHAHPRKGSHQIMVANSAAFQVGGIAEIQHGNDATVMFTKSKWDKDWANASVGQIVRIVGISSTTLHIDPPLYYDVRPDLQPVIRPLQPISNCGIEDLHLVRIDKSESNVIDIKYADQVRLLLLHSKNTTKSHVRVEASLHCEIRRCQFTDAHRHDGGGHGYGVNLTRHTTATLVEQCQFTRLRHAMMVQVGAIGNVFGYNTAKDAKSNHGHPLPDISLHGHYPAMNLFEANTVGRVGFADYWGPVGPGNTLLNNTIGGEVRVADSSHGQNLIGNHWPRSAPKIDRGVQRTLVVGNNDDERGRRDLPKTLYRVATPNAWRA